jgi:hypothetical protein
VTAADPNRDYLRFVERMRQWEVRAEAVKRTRSAGLYADEEELPEVEFDEARRRYRRKVKDLPRVRRA